MKFTELELKVVENIITSEYHDGRPIRTAADTNTWAFVATEGDSKRLRGALASLIKKGAAGIYECKHCPDDSIVYLTPEGLEAWNQG